MKKFTFNDYDFNNVGTQFDLVTEPDSNTTYRVKLSVMNDSLVLTDMGGELFNHYEVPYLKKVHVLYESQDQRCSACNHTKNIHGAFNNRLLCLKHYSNETMLAKMSIRDFLFKIENQEEYNIFKENYSSYIHNEYDLKFPCHIILHKEIDFQYDEETYTTYIINSDMGVVK